MKRLFVLFTALLTSTFGMNASETITETSGTTARISTFGYGNSFIFVENDITFSIFPNGEFDFYINNTPYGGAHVNIGFNAGYDYNSYLQYDDYGAVIQILNTPVFYDYYGRVAQIGNVRIFYNNRRVVRIGGLRIFYNPHGIYSHCSGYINVYNRIYVYRPFHRFFIRPVRQFCMVSFRPYREYYIPVRYSYYRPYRNNVRRCYATIGTAYSYKENNSRRVIYKNDKRVSRRDYSAYSRKSTSRREVAKTYEKTSKRRSANNYREDSKRNYRNTSENVSKRGASNTYKRSKNATTSTKRDKAPARKTTRSRNAVKHSPSKSVSRNTTHRSTSGRSTKTVRKSSEDNRKTTSKSRGKSKRSRT